MRKKIFISLLVFSGFAAIVDAQPTQDKSQLERERKEIQNELNEIQSQYNKVKGQTKLTVGQLNVLKRKMELQEQYISSISKELKSIDDDIYLSSLEIYRLQKQVDTLKSQYSKTVVYAYKNRSNYDYLNFIFSANSFNDAIRRIAYLKSYRSYREKQVGTILETQTLIAQRKEQQVGRKQQKNVALDNKTKQVEELAVQKKEKDVIVNQLKSKEKDLSKEIAAKKKKDKDLKNAITAIVRREIEAAKKAVEARVKAEAAEAKRKADEIAKNNKPVDNPATTKPVTTNKPSTNPTVSTTPKRNEPTKKPESYLDFNATDVALNNKFELNRAKLPWPVDNGVVTMNFGTNKIDNTLLTFDNPGITISTSSPGVAVKAVFDGEVSGVYNLGDGMAITIRHGKYFTTYSNLSAVSVSKGAIVKTGQQIAKAGKEDDGSGGQIDFILMIETRNVDPKPWLRR
ncbi:MAG: peptidoglycan DD-metalloendopeptidase family protein [Bacteroidota bacterium]|nr:peptidoglycan DD-metalloendopeptidase family protein [Bacteroidota bacterium]